MENPYELYKERYCNECTTKTCTTHEGVPPVPTPEMIYKCARLRECMSAFNLNEAKLDKIGY